MQAHNCELMDERTGIFSILGSVAIRLGGRYWWATDDIDTKNAKGVTLGAFKWGLAREATRNVALITVADGSGDPDEPDTLDCSQADVSRMDVMLHEAVSAQLRAEGDRLLGWEPSEMRELANRRCLVTSYVATVGQKRRQFVLARLAAGTRKLFASCAYDADDAEAEQIALCTEFWLCGGEHPAVSLFDLAFSFGKRYFDGSSPERAIVVGNVSEEYGIVRRHYVGFKRERQALTQLGGKRYDVLTLSKGSGNTIDLYFDVSKCFGREIPVMR